jgi:RNA polymerase sigma-70 factor (ECF subfamily)
VGLAAVTGRLPAVGGAARAAEPDLEGRLVARARAGDAAAFEALVRLHAELAYNLALRALGDPAEAEDVAQEAFVRAWRAMPRFREEARFGTWLYRIVTNLCYDRLPRLKQELAALDIDEAESLADERPSADTSLLDAELRARLHAAIDELPAGYRLLITLRHVHGLRYDEIATAAGMPLGTVKTGIHRARRRLREALEQG